MRFSAFSLFALSSLFVSSFAAPTAHLSREITVADVEQRDSAAVAVEERYTQQPEIVVILNSLYSEVFTITKSINVTVTPCLNVDITVTKKVSIIASIQVQIQKIISAFSLACLKIYKIKPIELPSIHFKLVIELSINIFLEIVFCILHAAKALKCSIVELLGFTIGLILHAYISFLIAIGGSVIGFIAAIKHAFGAHLIIIGQVFVDFGSLLSCL